MHSTKTINFHILVKDEQMLIQLSNVHYISKLDINLILYRERKKLSAINSLL